MKEKILSKLKKLQAVQLATCEGDQPRLRPMTLIVKDGRFFFATGNTDNKTKQMENNCKAEFCLLIPASDSTGYLRGTGKMQKVENQATRKEVADWAEFIYSYWKEASDPDYCLFELELQQMRHMEPGEMAETFIEW
ncbi:MAG: pyridoxamine 5'-phosphate oxidase family protein [Candidatus Cloacimonetes bacterium]|nr:pyridoxamine 5'-phosphate oxidase family protein [Candidatus Cloacimonadota bacterium]